MPSTSVVDSFESVTRGIASGDKKPLIKIVLPQIKRDFGGDLFLSGTKFIIILYVTIYNSYIPNLQTLLSWYTEAAHAK